MDAYTLTLYDDAGNPIPIPAIQGVGIKEIRLKEAGEVEDTYEIVLDDERVYTFVVKHGKEVDTSILIKRSGDTMEGALVAHNTMDPDAQVRNIYVADVGTEIPVLPDGVIVAVLV